MTRILVTGATGMLGSTLTPVLASGGHEVVRHGHSLGADIGADLTDAAATARMLDEVRPDAIVNLVALTNVDACEGEPHRAHLLNTRVVENLAAWAKERADAHLVQVSTDQVYDGEGLNREEDTRLTNTYALTKYAGELAAALCGATVLRTNLFGRSRLEGRKSLSDWLLQSLESGDAIKVFTDVAFSPLNMTTLSGFIGLAAERRVGGTYNLGSREGMSKADFAFALAEAFGLDSTCLTRDQSASVALKAYRPKNMCMDCRKFENSFGVALPTLVEEIGKLKREYEGEA